VTAAKRLRAEGVDIVAPPESFIVETGGETHLKEGELERARSWADSMGDIVAPREVVASAV
jgi:hypothetical protein